jgi:flavin-binding protein dodecin
MEGRAPSRPPKGADGAALSRKLCVVDGAYKARIFSMSDHIYKKIELVGSSPDGFEAAVKNALIRAEKTIRNMRWFEVTETRGHLENGKVNHWQVTLKVGFTLDA